MSPYRFYVSMSSISGANLGQCRSNVKLIRRAVFAKATIRDHECKIRGHEFRIHGHESKFVTTNSDEER